MRPHEIARTWLGVPWHHQGRNRHGIDCAGLAVQCYPVADRFDYDRNPRHGELERVAQEMFGPAIPKSQMRADDVVLLAFPNVIRHVGIIGQQGDRLTLIHTWAGGPRRVVEMPLDDQWMSRIKRVHRWGGAS